MFKKILVSAAVVSTLAAAAPANASLVSVLNGYSGPLYLTIAGLDNGTLYNPAATATYTGAQTDNPLNVQTPSAGAIGSEDSWGIFHITGIYTNATKTVQLWSEGGSNGYLLGVYGGLTDQTVSVTAGVSQSTYATGGNLAVFETNTLAGYIAAILAGAGGRDGSGNVGGVSGVGDLVLTADFSGTANVAVAGSSYSSNFTFGSGVGNGNGYFDVTGGSAADFFKDGAVLDAAGNPVDLSLTTVNNPANQTPSGWTLAFDGSVVGYDVPEPGSMALVGLALVGLGGLRRRKLPV